MLYLSGSDIRKCLSCNAAMDAVEVALDIQERGTFQMPDRLAMSCGDAGEQLLLMPSRTESALATKLVSVFPKNRDVGKAVIQGLVVYCDPNTGEILALMDGSTLTAMRTGAVSGVSIRHLAAENTSTLGLIGCGVQAYDQVLHACAARPIERVLLLDRSPASVQALTDKLSGALPTIEITAAPSLSALTRESQILITATTARTPVFPNDPALFENKHCIAIGSFEPTVREYPDAIFSRTSKVWVDAPHAQVESGELAIPIADGILQAEQIMTLGAQIASQSAPELGEFDCTFFKSVGMALFDLQTAQVVFAKARAAGLGVVLG
ncbi:MAG: ornithine cyclodeaminase family protein [Planctomycetes bacterium]|nr:ornithine cyclodeaminase family protein [Planctomycetota bacterium]